MKVVIFSDLHLHNFAAFARSGQNGLNTRLLDGLEALSRIGRAAREAGAGAVIFAGDLFHGNRIDVDVYALGAETLQAIARSVPVVMVAGNHDQANRWLELDALRPLDSGAGGIRVLRGWGDHVEVGGVTVRGLPYGSRPPADGLRADVAILHAGVRGAQVTDHFASASDEDWPLGALEGLSRRLTIAGHFHRPQRFGRVLVPGAPMQHNWGDEGEDRGYWVCDLESGEAAFHPLDGLPRFVRVTSDRLDRLDDARGNFVMVDIGESLEAGVVAELAQHLEEVSRGYVIRAAPARIVRRSVVSGPSAWEAVESFVADHVEDLDVRQRLLALARKYLGGAP